MVRHKVFFIILALLLTSPITAFAKQKSIFFNQFNLPAIFKVIAPQHQLSFQERNRNVIETSSVSIKQFVYKVNVRQSRRAAFSGALKRAIRLKLKSQGFSLEDKSSEADLKSGHGFTFTYITSFSSGDISVYTVYDRAQAMRVIVQLHEYPNVQ